MDYHNNAIGRAKFQKNASYYKKNLFWTKVQSEGEYSMGNEIWWNMLQNGIYKKCTTKAEMLLVSNTVPIYIKD